MFLGNTYLIPAISNLPGQGTSGTPSNFMLDIIPGAFTDLIGAYSLRKLTSTYTGPCCTVQRVDGQGGSLDVNFDSLGYIDIQPAIDLCTGTGYPFSGNSPVLIETWYDQSGSGNNLSGDVPGAQALTLVVGSTGLPLTAPSGFYYLGEGSTRKVGGSFVIPAGSDITTFSTSYHPFATGGHANWQLLTGISFLQGRSSGSPQLSSLSGTLPGGAAVNLNGNLSITTNRLNLQTDILRTNTIDIELESGLGLVEAEDGDTLITEQGQLEASFFVNAGTAGTDSQLGEYPSFVQMDVPSTSGGDDNDPAEFLIYKNDKSSIRAAIDSNTVAYYSLPTLNLIAQNNDNLIAQNNDQLIQQ